jgi:hypothetical protein
MKDAANAIAAEKTKYDQIVNERLLLAGTLPSSELAATRPSFPMG